mgnify:FL=1|jgi:hypothetical protein
MSIIETFGPYQKVIDLTNECTKHIAARTETLTALIASERENQRLRSVLQEIADTPAKPSNHDLVAVVMLAQYTIRDGRNGPR